MELQGKIQRILKSYGVKRSYRVKCNDFKKLLGKMELWGGKKRSYRVKCKDFKELLGKMKLWGKTRKKKEQT